MPRRCYRAVVVAAVLALSGCTLWNPRKQAATYETIAANPTYDTEEAEKQHAKALKILNGCSCYNSVLALLASEQTLAKAQIEELALTESHLQKALVADVTYGPAHNTLGIVYMIQRKYYLAAWEFEYAAELMPEQIEPLYNLGLLYEISDKLDSAIECYEQAHAIAPRDPVVTGSLASTRLRAGISVDELRPLLESIVFGDNRPEWIDWARDQLGRNPIPIVAGTLPTTQSSLVVPAAPAKPIWGLSSPGDVDAGRAKSVPEPPLPVLPGSSPGEPPRDGANKAPTEEPPAAPMSLAAPSWTKCRRRSRFAVPNVAF